MADPSNTVASRGRPRSVQAGDVPEALRRRYYLDGRGGAGVGFYVDARVEAPAFRDRGHRLDARRNNPNAIRDMAVIAQHRGWTAVVVRGDTAFRREAWLAARAVGIAVTGYRATERDRQDLERRQAKARGAEPASQPAPDVPARRATGGAPMALVEAVVRARVADDLAQQRILNAARARIAHWLQLGAQLAPPRPGPEEPGKRHPRERHRGR